MKTLKTIYTIGHSNHTIGDFLSLLKKHGIDVIADVRSSPYSRFHDQFNREIVKDSLRNEGIKYVFLGKALGARPDDRSCYSGNTAKYSLIEKTPLFHQGIERVIKGAEAYTVALMCAEKEPLDCHRTILVSRWLVSKGLKIEHILPDGRTEPHTETEKRLLKLTKQETADMFAGDPLERAYEIRGQEICFKEQSDTEPSGVL